MNTGPNEIVIKFTMNGKEYKKWVNGEVFYDDEKNKILSIPFLKLVKFATAMTSFQHLKNEHCEVEIKFNEKDLIKLASYSLSLIPAN